uniref:Doublecortin domain containing 2C n=1 Tax=Salvator merianae TaxID=96440 RepID=A0A8D0DJ74_SALMN
MVGTARLRAVYSLTDATPARTIWVYRNGDPYYLGRKFVINHRYVPNFEALMIQLNEGVPTPFGVRNIYTPRQGHSVTDLPDLQQGGRYVVAGRERFRKLNLQMARGTWRLLVFTNGDLLVAPMKIIIPKFTQKSWNSVLGLINEKVLSHAGGVHRLYMLNGHPVHGSDDLEHNQFYVGCGKEKFQPLPYWQHPKVPEDPTTEPSKHGAGDRSSVYYAKPEKASRERAAEPLSSDDGGGVYRARVPPREVKGAQEIQEDKNIQVEVPVDQVVNETKIRKHCCVVRRTRVVLSPCIQQWVVRVGVGGSINLEIGVKAFVYRLHSLDFLINVTNTVPAANAFPNCRDY